MRSWIQSKARLCLPLPSHDASHLPVPRGQGRMATAGRRARDRFQNLFKERQKKRDNQILQEFRSKLRTADDLISKLAYSLQEIQGMRRKTKEDEAHAPKSPVLQMIKDRS